MHGVKTLRTPSPHATDLIAASKAARLKTSKEASLPLTTLRNIPGRLCPISVCKGPPFSMEKIEIQVIYIQLMYRKLTFRPAYHSSLGFRLGGDHYICALVWRKWMHLMHPCNPCTRAAAAKHPASARLFRDLLPGYSRFGAPGCTSPGCCPPFMGHTSHP